LRAFDATGLDNPAGWSSGSVCVADGQSVYITVNNGSIIANAADYIKATTWWYDKNHDVGLDHAKVDLGLEYWNGMWMGIQTGATNDNKQRVLHDAPAGSSWRLRITGRSIATDIEGCGSNAVRVYYAWMYEDNARDDDANLSTYIRPEF